LSFESKFPYIFVTDEASDFLADNWGLKRPIMKSHPKKKWVWLWARGAPQNFGYPIIFLRQLKLATSNLTLSWGVPRTIIKSHAEEKGGVALD